MSQIDVNNVLSQMRALSAQASNPLASSSASSESSALSSSAGTDFASVFAKSLNQVSSLQNDAQAQQQAFERGDPGSDIVKTSIAGQTADLAFRGLVEVRNKLTDAYTTIMNMQV